jgi:hypothetical protein
MRLLQRWAVLCLLASAPSIAFSAAPTCWPSLTSPTFLKIAGPQDSPEVGEVIYSASPVGLVWGYSCIASDGKWYKVIAAGAWDKFPADWLYILDTVLRGTDADRTALWNKYATGTEWDARLKPDLDAIWARLPSPPPPPAAVLWRVLADPFRADKRRVIYNAAGGKRGTATTQTIAAGEPCDPVTTITEFGPVYFLSVLGKPNLVARCVKQ